MYTFFEKNQYLTEKILPEKTAAGKRRGRFPAAALLCRLSGISATGIVAGAASMISASVCGGGDGAVEGRIEGIEVPGVQIILEHPKRFPEPGRMVYQGKHRRLMAVWDTVDSGRPARDRRGQSLHVGQEPGNLS